MVDPCAGLRLPAVRGRRERYASPTEAEALIAAVPERDRAIWATPMFGGLRLGELRALRVGEVDLATGVIHVEAPFTANMVQRRADKAWKAQGLRGSLRMHAATPSPRS